MREQGDTGSLADGGGLGELVRRAKSDARSREVTRQPRRFRQVGTAFLETDEDRVATFADPPAPCGGRIKAEVDPGEPLRDDIAVLGAAEANGDIGFPPFKAHVANIRGDLDVEGGMLSSERGQPRDQETLRQSRRGIHANQPGGYMVAALSS